MTKLSIRTYNNPAGALRFVGVGLAIVMPVILPYLGRAHRMFRGKAVETHAEVYAGPALQAGRRGQASQTGLHLS